MPRYYVVDVIDEGEGYQYVGVYMGDPHAVVLITSQLFVPRTIIHEDLHALGFFHGDEEFIRCLD